jgi:hypothetical protein
MHAFEEEFPGIKIKGCNFYKAQCIWQKIQHLGLATAYQQDVQLRKWLKLFKGLSFVPLNLVTVAFNYIVSIKPLSDHIEKIVSFINYYRSTWLDSSSMFPPKIWNHYDTIGPRTNNHVEGYNFKLNRYSFCNHPNIFELINLLKSMESTISRKWIKRCHGEAAKVYRRPIDKKEGRNSIESKNFIILQFHKP